MLKAEGKISDAVIENMLSWHHSGFNVYCGPTIWPSNDKGLEDLARYIIRACFSQERMTYIPSNAGSCGGAKVIYRSKDGKTSKIFGALDWLAQLVSHIPNRYEQMVRYYGYYSNKSRGMRKKAGMDDQVPALVESGISSAAFRENWARLIQKIYQVDPLLCPKCQGEMRIISFIEYDQLIRKILTHLGLWETRNQNLLDDVTLESVNVPSYVVAHENDGCFVTPPSDVTVLESRLSVGSPKVKVKTFTGGTTTLSNECKALSAHGFFGIEPHVVSDIGKWIRKQILN